jgi:hypothetical protein
MVTPPVKDDGNPACGPGAGDCCTPNGSPGCDDDDAGICGICP